MKNEEANFQPLRSTTQKDLESDASSISWNFCARFSDANQWGRPKLPAIFSGYYLSFSKTLFETVIYCVYLFSLFGAQSSHQILLLIENNCSDTSKHLFEVLLKLWNAFTVSDNLQQIFISNKIETWK